MLPLLFGWIRKHHGDENPAKRARIDDAPAIKVSASSLTDLNDNCLVHMLSYLPFEDLNSVDVCNRHCREVRRHESLDQTRSGTIVCRENTTIESLLNAVANNRWRNIFKGNRTNLRIEGFERLPSCTHNTPQSANRALLRRVTSLNLSRNPRDAERPIQHNTLMHLVRILPNLREVNLSHVKTVNNAETTIFLELSRYCPLLSVLSWNGVDGSIDMHGMNLRTTGNLTEFYIDDAHFILTGQSMAWARMINRTRGGAPELHLFALGPRGLERVSIKGATMENQEDGLERQSLSQETIIRFVRNTPTLRWLRSDLSDENMAMLKQKRPEVTFASD